MNTPAANLLGNGDANRRTEKKKGGDRFHILNTFVDNTLADLNKAEAKLWLILYRDTRDGMAKAGYNDLARRAGIDRRNVGRALRRLQDRGLLEVIKKGSLTNGVSTYRVSPAAREPGQ
jgi:hypothetical protein